MILHSVLVEVRWRMIDVAFLFLVHDAEDAVFVLFFK